MLPTLEICRFDFKIDNRYVFVEWKNSIEFNYAYDVKVFSKDQFSNFTIVKQEPNVCASIQCLREFLVKFPNK